MLARSPRRPQSVCISALLTASGLSLALLASSAVVGSGDRYQPASRLPDLSGLEYAGSDFDHLPPFAARCGVRQAPAATASARSSRRKQRTRRARVAS